MTMEAHFLPAGIPSLGISHFHCLQTHPEEMFTASVLTTPSANIEPTRIKKGSWETGRGDPACNSFALEFISCFPGKCWGNQEGCPASPRLQARRDLGEGRGLARFPSLHKGRQSRDVFLEGPENSRGSSQTAGQDEEVLVMAIKRSQVLGWGARNPPTGQAGSEAAFHISAVRTFLFICSSVSAKKEGGAAPFPLTTLVLSSLQQQKA